MPAWLNIIIAAGLTARTRLTRLCSSKQPDEVAWSHALRAYISIREHAETILTCSGLSPAQPATPASCSYFDDP